jgi:hypothetical protein
MDDRHLGGERHGLGSSQLIASPLVAALTTGIAPAPKGVLHLFDVTF